jgi:ribosome-binding protein aMBF1 (putative translation factor)
MARKTTSNALEIMDREFGKDPQYLEMLAEERVMAQAARAIYEARTSAGLTQQQLAQLVGTQPSVIARLEDGDYEGHSLAMMQRVAEALHQRIELRFVPTTPGGAR